LGDDPLAYRGFHSAIEAIEGFDMRHPAQPGELAWASALRLPREG